MSSTVAAMGAPLTEAAIRRMQDMIVSGRLAPGFRLPPEADLARELGASRSTVREAVRALVTARVLDVRRGDGTYVTSLRPELLLGGIGAAAELMQGGNYQLELVQVRRILEPAATALAAQRLDRSGLIDLEVCLMRMTEASSEDELVQFDAEFHALVAQASGNETLASMLKGVSSQTVRTRAWRGVIEDGAVARTLSQHAEILRALRDADPVLAHAAALVHVATTEDWVRRMLTNEHV
jgi:GntR family transcriptional repressor for pyruvate dehydrogenase complex